MWDWWLSNVCWAKHCQKIKCKTPHHFTGDAEIIKPHQTCFFKVSVKPAITSVVWRPFFPCGETDHLPRTEISREEWELSLKSMKFLCKFRDCPPCNSVFIWFKWWKTLLKKQTSETETCLLNVFPLLSHVMSLWMSKSLYLADMSINSLPKRPNERAMDKVYNCHDRVSGLFSLTTEFVIIPLYY